MQYRMDSSSLSSFERLTSAKMKPMTSRRKLKKLKRKYRRATSSLPKEDRPKTFSELEKSGYVLSESLIELDLEKARNLTPKQAAIYAALAVAEAEDGIAEAEEAVREAEAAEALAEAIEAEAEAIEAEAEAIEAEAEAAEAAEAERRRVQGKTKRQRLPCTQGTLPSMPLNMVLPFPKNRAPSLVCLNAEVEASIAEVEASIAEVEELGKEAEADAETAQAFSQAALKMRRGINSEG